MCLSQARLALGAWSKLSKKSNCRSFPVVPNVHPLLGSPLIEGSMTGK